MGDSTQTSTSSTASSDPKVKATLDQLLGGVQDIWKQGPQVYGKSLYSPAGSTTQNAWSQGTNFANGLLGSGGLTPGQTSANKSLSGIGSAYGALGDNNGLTGLQSFDLSKMGGLAGQYGALSTAYDQNAPGYQALKDSITQNTLGSVNSMFGGEGRLGSGLNYQSAAKGLGEALAPLDYQNYQNSVNNKYQSLNDQQGLYQSLFGDQQTGVGNQFNSLSGRTGIADQQFANGQTAIGNRNNALQTLGGIGTAQDANAQGILTGNANLWDAQHNGKLGLLSQLMGALNGSAQLGGTTTTSTQPGTPWWQTLLGGAIGGAGIASKL